MQISEIYQEIWSILVFIYVIYHRGLRIGRGGFDRLTSNAKGEDKRILGGFKSWEKKKERNNGRIETASGGYHKYFLMFVNKY